MISDPDNADAVQREVFEDDLQSIFKLPCQARYRLRQLPSQPLLQKRPHAAAGVSLAKPTAGPSRSRYLAATSEILIAVRMLTV
jgi:hypothetical protein